MTTSLYGRPVSTGPFNREKWLARTSQRRNEEFKDKNLSTLMSTPEYVGAVRAYKQASRGDPESYFEWTDQNTYTLSNKFMPSDYGNQYEEQFYTNYGPTSYVSPSKRSPSTLPPLGGKNMGRSASTPSMPTSMRGAQHPTWSADHADPNHVDHSLEMFRTGHGAGGAYKFDGEVAASGAGDSKPVTDYELECAHDLIRDKLKTRFSSFRGAFRAIDENRSGKVTKIEALRMLMMLNLKHVREKVMNKLCDIMDKDGDGVEYDEFCNWLVAEDAKDLGPSGRPSSKMSSKLSSKAPSMSSSRPKPPTPAPVNKLMPKPQTPMKKPLKAHKGGDWVNAVAEDAPMRENDGHVDHSLEMFRTGHAMGGNYKYDGEVAASGRDEHGPVTEKELETAHDLLREKLNTRFSTFRRAFREIDENRSGKVTKIEALRMLMMLNLKHVREKVMNKLCDIMDRNGDGIDYEEFCKWLMAEDAKLLV